MITIKLGGVPEHFNLPILLAIEKGAFLEGGIDLQWQYFPGGTGAMTKALRDENLDLAILLTEGFVAAAASGLQARVVKTYIESPLIWGIYTGYHSATKSVYDHSLKRYAISRYGSGSHLMALIHAEQRGEKLETGQFEVVNSIEGGIASLQTGASQIFYWEKLMTKTYVEKKMVRLIGTFSAPWSGFLIVASDEALAGKREAITKAMHIINAAVIDFMRNPMREQLLEERFGLMKEDIAEWMLNTVWNEGFGMNERGLQNAIDAVSKIVDLQRPISVGSLIFRL